MREAQNNEADPGVYPKWFRQRVESVIQSLKGQTVTISGAEVVTAFGVTVTATVTG